MSDNSTEKDLKSIWEDAHVKKLPVKNNSQRQWKCLWCNNTFNQWNSTKAIYHLNRIKGYSIKSSKIVSCSLQQPCSSDEIDKLSQERYVRLMVSLEVKRKRISEKRVAFLEDVDGSGGGGGGVDANSSQCPPISSLPSVGSVWKDPKITKIQNEHGEKYWKCLWCDNYFSQWNATKAIHHLNKRKGCDIKMDESSKHRYADLMIAVDVKRRKKNKRLNTQVHPVGAQVKKPEELVLWKAPPTDIWLDDHIQKGQTATGEQFWKCLWCNETFNQWNATQAVHHVNQVQGGEIEQLLTPYDCLQPCASTEIDEEHKRHYQALQKMFLHDSQSKQTQNSKDSSDVLLGLDTSMSDGRLSKKRRLAVRDLNEAQSTDCKPELKRLEPVDDQNLSPEHKRKLELRIAARNAALSSRPSKSQLSRTRRLQSIWDDTHVIKTLKPTGGKCWKCLWCHKQFSQWNATKAIYHVNQYRGNDIQPCTARNIDEKHKHQYHGLMEALRKKRRKQKLQRKGKDVFLSFVEKIVEHHDEEVANNLDNFIDAD
eukprot:scaffold174_cov98-Cylindrotheca_fusiformis.AAC.5